MEPETEGEVQKDQLQRHGVGRADRHVGQEKMGQRSRGYEQVEDGRQNGSEGGSEKEKEEQEGGAFLGLSHASAFLMGFPIHGSRTF